MFGMWGKARIDEDTVDNIIMYLNENPDDKRRIIMTIFDKEIFIQTIFDIVEKEGNKINDIFKLIVSSKLERIEKRFDEIIVDVIKSMDLNKKINSKIDEIFQSHPEYKTLKELGKALKEANDVNDEIRKFLKKSTITTLIEQTKGGAK